LVLETTKIDSRLLIETMNEKTWATKVCFPFFVAVESPTGTTENIKCRLPFLKMDREWRSLSSSNVYPGRSDPGKAHGFSLSIYHKKTIVLCVCVREREQDPLLKL
jgi:hypothetical protein